ncbi:MAG: UMP kinase [Pseudomonadota bacterium]
MFKYTRVLLKLSGEFFADHGNESTSPFASSALSDLVNNLAELRQQGVQIAIVIGGGNIVRGEFLAQQGFDRIASDHMGMVATLINGLMLSECCKKANLPCKLVTLLDLPDVIASYQAQQAIQDLARNFIVICAGGTGKPLCTTDSAAAQRAVDVKADIILKATKVDGIYSADPKLNPDAKFYSTLSFDEAIEKKLAVMDLQAFEYCRANNMPIRVFNMHDSTALKKLVCGEPIGTLVSN